ncbi:Leucine-rich PPR motif-containing protein, mitochondrial [Armadillidium nasatum]|uniref:Leucine-rich PPR motif-containing protein, mitochondrial n=1 Tax=Armadillidium nasatum TaxID=96803 RepID=A0A5N5SYG9_9CRUS|nr:Leucine-rich PPR motif-containing protein, mitochondrial [Armadillidium nasatum]
MLEEQSLLIMKEILSFMENNNYSWSQKVCELLVSNLCQWEMTEEIDDLFLKMKSSNISLNDNIYSSLILLYGKKRDLQRVHDLYSSVQEDQSHLFSSPQSALIIAYNTCEEYEKARSVLEEFDDLDKKLDSDQYCNILISAIESGCYDKNLDYLSYIINLKNILIEGVEVDFKKLVNRLLTSNYLKEAVFLLSMEKSDKPPQSYYLIPSADSVREFIKIKESDASAVIAFCYELVRNKVNEYAFEIALEYSLSIENSNLSFELFKYLKSKRQLKEHFFWPLFLSKKDPNLEKTLEIVKKMNELGVNIGLQTLLHYIIPTLPLDTPEQSLQMLVAHGLSRTKVITPLLCTLISREKYEEVYDLLKENRIPFILNSLLYEPLAKIFCRDRKAATELLLSLYRNGLQDEIADISRIINQFASYVQRASKRNISVNDVLYHFKEIENEDFLLPSSKGEYSSSSKLGSTFHKPENFSIDSLERRGLPQTVEVDIHADTDIPEDHFADEEHSVTALSSNNYLSESRNKRYSSSSHDPEENITSHMSIEELEGHLIELKSKGMNVRGVLRRLLLKHSSSGNRQRVREISKELEASNTFESPGMISSTLYNNVLEGDTDAAVKQFNHLNENYPNFRIDAYKVVDLCSLCVRMGKTSESMDIMRKFLKSTPKSSRQYRGILHNCHQLLTECSNAGGYSFVRQMCSTLLSGDLIKPCTVIFGPLIKAKLQNNDLVGAVEEAEEIFFTHNILAYRIELLKEILESDEDDQKVMPLVERVVDLISKSRGPRQAKRDLLSASLHVGNEELANKIFKQCEDDLNKESIKHMCDYYVKLENARGLLLLLSISKGSSSIDRIHVCDSLLNIYFINRNSKDAINLSILMQEESLTPSASFKTKFENLLRATGSVSSSSSVLGTTS